MSQTVRWIFKSPSFLVELKISTIGAWQGWPAGDRLGAGCPEDLTPFLPVYHAL